MRSRSFRKGFRALGSYLSIIVELTVGLLALLILTKFVGKASLSESTPFDFIAMIVVGDFVSDAVYDHETHIFKVLFTIALWGLLILLIDWITLKYHRSRGFFESHPEVVITNGVIDRQRLKKSKVDMNHLLMLLRDRDVFSIREVEYAILEPNGKVSVIKKPQLEPATREDMKVPYTSVSLPVTVISDGVILQKGLKQIHKTEGWLRRKLKERHITDLAQVMVAEWREEDGLFVQTIHPESPGDQSRGSYRAQRSNAFEKRTDIEKGPGH
ncbi:DUF421 domain-containing protein [Sporolactobacillus sp. THM7-7]|nr:DUF421 domain-containing protein [Sporolactobacillus sp. THM7-7]